MAVENETSNAGHARPVELRAVSDTHRFIGQSWMGWAALYAVLMLLDQFAGH
jgi:hypothetical protein